MYNITNNGSIQINKMSPQCVCIWNSRSQPSSICILLPSLNQIFLDSAYHLSTSKFPWTWILSLNVPCPPCSNAVGWTGYNSNHQKHLKGCSKSWTPGTHPKISQEQPQPREWHHQNGIIGDPNLHPPTKINNYLSTNKNSSVRSLESTYKTSAHCQTKNLRLTTHTQTKENSFILPGSSHPSSQYCSTPRENSPARKSSPSWGKKSVVCDQLLSLHCTKRRDI